MISSIQFTEGMSSFVGMGTHQTSNKILWSKKRGFLVLFLCFFLMKELFLFKSTKKGKEVFRTCKLHTVLAVESRQCLTCGNLFTSKV